MASAEILEVIKTNKVEQAWLYHLEATDDYLCSKVCTIIEQQVIAPDFRDFNSATISCQSNTKTTQVVDALMELPVLSPTRYLCLNNVQNLSSEAAQVLSDNLPNALAPQLTVIVLVWHPGGRSKALTALKSQSKKLGLNIRCSLEEKDRLNWIAARLAQLHVKTDSSAVAEIANRTGNDLQNLDSQLMKIAQFVGSSKALAIADVRSLVRKSVETKAWEFTAAVGTGNRALALQAAAALMDGDASGGAFGLLSYTNSYLRSLAQVKTLADRYGSNPNILEQHLTNKKPYQIKKSLAEARTWSWSELRTAFSKLCLADLRIKTGAEPGLTIQLLVMHLCSHKGQR